MRTKSNLPLRVVVITPVTDPTMATRANVSVLEQVCPPGWAVEHHVVADGRFEDWKIGPGSYLIQLPHKTGQHQGDNWYGHRVYAYYSQLVDADYVLFLDQDNIYGPTHVERSVVHASVHGFSWSKRSIYTEDDVFICDDDFEAICDPSYVGYSLVDTSTWCFRHDHVHNAVHICGNWGADRLLTDHMLYTYGPAKLQAAGTGYHSMMYTAPPRLEDFFRSYSKKRHQD